jgi:hypothetical protein
MPKYATIEANKLVSFIKEMAPLINAFRKQIANKLMH